MKRFLKIMILLLSLSALTACGADEQENDLPTGDGVVMTAVITEVDYTWVPTSRTAPHTLQVSSQRLSYTWSAGV